MSIKKNYIASLVQTIANLLFPLITFPYIARILGPENLGRVEFANSIIYYFLAFAHLGIPLYGAREIAKNKEDINKIGKITSELLAIYLLTSIIAILTLYSYTYLSPKSIDFKKFIYLGGLSIISSSLSFSWVLQGLEKHRYISFITIIFRFLYIILLYYFVTSRSDTLKYMSLSVIIGYLISISSFMIIKKNIPISFKGISPQKHIKNIILASGISLSEVILFQANTLMLGTLSDTMQVGLYATSLRLIRLSEGIITSLSKVAMPRASFYFADKKSTRGNHLKAEILSATLLLALPATAGLYYFSSDLIHILAGKEYYNATTCLKVATPYIITSCLTSFYLNLVYLPTGKDICIISRNVTLTVLAAALNLYLIPAYGAIGASTSLMISSIVGVILYAMISREYLFKDILSKDNLIAFICTGIMSFFLILLPERFTSNMLLDTFSKVFISAAVYGSSTLLLSHSISRKALKILTIKIKLKDKNELL